MDTTQRHLEPRAPRAPRATAILNSNASPPGAPGRIWLALVVTGVVAIVATRSAAAQTSAPATERLPPLDSAADAGLPSVGVPPEEVSGCWTTMQRAESGSWCAARAGSIGREPDDQPSAARNARRAGPLGDRPDHDRSLHRASQCAVPSGPAPTGPPIVTFLGNIYINAGYSGRVAVIGDSTRLNSTLTNGTFLALAIPVPGQPFYGTKEQAAVQGAGSSLALNGQILTDADNAIQFSTKFLTQNTGISTDPTNPSTNNPSVSIQQAYARLSKVLVGVMESGFAPIDNWALPETLDLAGPGARVSVLSLGSTGAGQGRGRYYLFSTNDNRPGFTGIVSAENPVPEITTRTAAAGTYGTMSRCPTSRPRSATAAATSTARTTSS